MLRIVAMAGLVVTNTAAAQTAEFDKCKSLPLGEARISCMRTTNDAARAEWQVNGEAARTADRADLIKFKDASLKVIADDLKDADSAKYKNIRVIEVPDTWKDGTPYKQLVLCADVNAKNSYGGYTGFKTWMVHRHWNNKLVPSTYSSSCGKDSNVVVQAFD